MQGKRTSMLALPVHAAAGGRKISVSASAAENVLRLFGREAEDVV